MPKENVNDHVTPGFRMEIGWSQDGHVQVATTNAASPFRFPDEETIIVQGPGGEERALSTRSVGPGEPFDGWFVTLDRDGCNRAIRALRKARDAAYGPDA